MSICYARAFVVYVHMLVFILCEQRTAKPQCFSPPLHHSTTPHTNTIPIHSRSKRPQIGVTVSSCLCVCWIECLAARLSRCRFTSARWIFFIVQMCWCVPFPVLTKDSSSSKQSILCKCNSVADTVNNKNLWPTAHICVQFGRKNCEKEII